jgi:hypothetical protein
MIVDVAHPTAGQVRLLAPPYKLDRTPASVDRHPPLLGEHTEEVLREQLGLDTPSLAELGSGGHLDATDFVVNYPVVRPPNGRLCDHRRCKRRVSTSVVHDLT